MRHNIPAYIAIAFGLTTLLTLGLFGWTLLHSSSHSTRKNAVKIILFLVLWLIVQAAFTLEGVYYSYLSALPPMIFLFGILPAMLTILAVFITPKGRSFIDHLPLKNLTYLHTVRIPVEVVLYWLFLNGSVPELMTFTGRNFDIIAGLTAPFVAYFGFVKKQLGPKLILTWNFVCLGLLLNIVGNAFLSAPTPLQRFAFEQPNIAILYFPFSWLPVFIVPMVLFSHLVAIRRLV